MLDNEFLRFCIVIIQFFKKNDTLDYCANHLLKCLNGEILLRGQYEKMLRVIILEGKNRDENIINYLEYIREIQVPNIEYKEIIFDANQLPEDN